MNASGRLVRSILRNLRDRVGDAAYEAIGRELGGAPQRVMTSQPSSTESSRPSPSLGGARKGDWIPLSDWLPIIELFERRFGDVTTWQLLRETTRATMAVAVAKGWSAFMADITPDLLLQRSGTFWSMSYDTGQLVVLGRGPRRCRMAIEGWPSPPQPVVAQAAEACVVFLVRLGERGGRVREEMVDGRAELEITW
jgi:hypothetical protein